MWHNGFVYTAVRQQGFVYMGLFELQCGKWLCLHCSVADNSALFTVLATHRQQLEYTTTIRSLQSGVVSESRSFTLVPDRCICACLWNKEME